MLCDLWPSRDDEANQVLALENGKESFLGAFFRQMSLFFDGVTHDVLLSSVGYREKRTEAVAYNCFLDVVSLNMSIVLPQYFGGIRGSTFLDKPPWGLWQQEEDDTHESYHGPLEERVSLEA